MALVRIWRMAREEIYVTNIEYVMLYFEHYIMKWQCQGNKPMNMHGMEKFLMIATLHILRLCVKVWSSIRI